MIRRNYFFKVESLPTLQKGRREDGKITMVTGFAYHRSIFSNPEKVKKYIIDKVANEDHDFLKGGMILTALSRL